jgi:hypothetical protein
MRAATRPTSQAAVEGLSPQVDFALGQNPSSHVTGRAPTDASGSNVGPCGQTSWARQATRRVTRAEARWLHSRLWRGCLQSAGPKQPWRSAASAPRSHADQMRQVRAWCQPHLQDLQGTTVTLLPVSRMRVNVFGGDPSCMGAE